ncbi:MAG: minichromosome maintenance protein MCM [Sphaerochaetaceae bacterium]
MGTDGLRVADDIIERPARVIGDIRDALASISMFAETRTESDRLARRINIRFVNISRKTEVRSLRNQNARRLVCVEGIVRKTSERVYQHAQEVAFQCQNGHITRIPQAGQLLDRPERCPHPGCSSKRFRIVPEQSEYVDCQKIRIQESPEGRMDSSPQSIDGYLFDDIAGTVKAGDRLQVVAIVRASPKHITGGISANADYELEILSVEVSQRAFEDIALTDEDITQIEELSQNPDLESMMIRSIAPHIHGHEDQKAAIVLQLIGAPTRPLPDGARMRGDTHILLIGDPGVGKSEMIRSAIRASPRGMFTSGRSTTGGGLTAVAVKDDFGDGKWSVESGLLVQADRGLAGIDEMEKIGPTDLATIHEAMEQQTISFSKAGINITLECRTAILGGANPKYGKFDPNEAIGSQIALPPTLLSRFDLIFVMQDLAIQEQDEAIVETINIAHRVGTALARLPPNSSQTAKEEVLSQYESVTAPIEIDLLRKYIAYAKRIIPGISPAAEQMLSKYYLPVRVKSQGKENRNTNDHPLPITARNYYGLLRLSEAHARMRLSNTVETEDVAEAVRLTDISLRQVAYDPETGEIDMGRITVGMTGEERKTRTTVLRLIREVSDGNSAHRDIVISGVMNALNLSQDKANRTIDKMIGDGTLRSFRRQIMIVGDQ